MARLWNVGKSEPIKIGKASPTEGALPSSLYFTLKYQNSTENALIANANVGGDSAVRGIVIGMLLGAHRSFSLSDESHVPARWLGGLNAMEKVSGLIDDIVGFAVGPLPEAGGGGLSGAKQTRGQQAEL